MASNNVQSMRCTICQSRFKPPTAGITRCSECQRVSPPARQQSVKSPNNSSIPSEYLQLLDSRIADLETAAEASRSSDQSPARTNASNRLNRLPQTPPYTMDSRPRNLGNSPRQTQADSVVMQRFLHDSREPDGVRDAILASRNRNNR